MLEAFGALCIIALFFYLIDQRQSARRIKDNDNVDLSKYVDNSIEIKNPVNSDAGKKDLRKILSDPEVRMRAERRRNDEHEQKQKEADLRRKDLIIKRTFSYKYENIVYEIFAPYARKRSVSYNGQSWEVKPGMKLDNDFVISEISRLLDLPFEKANELFWEFEENDMISVRNRYDTDTPKKEDRCGFGYLLGYEWNIISNEDMNISKWIEQHHDRF